MQIAIHALRCHRAETATSYTGAGKCVNSFVYRVLINTTKANVGRASCSAGFSLWVFLFLSPEKSNPTG
jgi:hypothetical protein